MLKRLGLFKMLLQNVLYGVVFVVHFYLTAAHSSQLKERRDLANVYYGPDTDNIDFLPVPNGTVPTRVDPKTGYYLEHLGFGTYFITEGAYQTLFLVSTVGVILVDCPPTIGYNLKAAIKSVTDRPVTHFIYSHSHAEHVAGAYIFNDTVQEYIAQEHTRKELELLLEPDPRRPMPNRVFKKEKRLKVGNQTLELSYKGPNHHAGNIFIYAPAVKTLMLVDVVWPGWVPYPALGFPASVPDWIRAHSQILEYDFRIFIGGHLERYGTREDVLVQQEYVMDLRKNCAAALTAFRGQELGPVLKANPGNSWAAVKWTLKLETDECAANTNRKWNGRLKGSDVVGWENAYKMIDSLRIDFGVLPPPAGSST